MNKVLFSTLALCLALLLLSSSYPQSRFRTQVSKLAEVQAEAPAKTREQLLESRKKARDGNLDTNLGRATDVISTRGMVWPSERPPRLSLSDAYAYAVAALGLATNRHHGTGASCFITPLADGEWMFSFHNTNGESGTAFVCVSTRRRAVSAGDRVLKHDVPAGR